MTDFKLPDLPSDEELGIADMDDAEDSGGGSEASPPSGDPGTPDAPPARAGAGPAGLPGWTGWVTLVVLLLGGWFSSSYRSLPAPAPATAPETAFASGRALPELVELARAPRPPGSPEHARVRGWIVDRLAGMGLEPRVQVATPTVTSRNRIRAATVRNVMARVEGTDPTGAVLVVAHYDGVPGSPAAGDDGSGVVSILEALRALQAGEPPRNDVIVLFTDAEELGLLGARAFVDEDPWMADVRVVLNVEMRGTGGPSIMFETADQNGWIIQRFAAGSEASPVAMSASMAAYERLPNITDFTVFRDVGVQGLNFAAVGRARHYHEATDRPGVVQESSLQHQGQLVLSSLRTLAAADLTEVNGPDRSWVTLPFLGVVTLPAVLTLPVTLGILAALLLVTFLASVRGARSRGFLSAAILSTAVVGLSAGAGWVLVNVFLPMSEIFAAGGITPAVHDEWPWRLALIAGVVALVTGVFSLAHRWMSPLEATLGALFLPVLALLAVTLLAPLAAISLQGPLVAITLLLLLLAGVGLHRARGMAAWLASLLLALPVLAFLVPILEQIFIAFTMRSAPVLGAATAVCLLMILPALSALERPNRWWAPALAFAAAWIGVGAGWLQRAPSSERPAPSVLHYVMERDERGIPDRAVWATREDSGLDWARRVVEGAFTAEPDAAELALAGLAPGGGGLTASAAPLAALPAPAVTVLSDRLEAGDRRIRVSVRSRLGAELLRLELGEGVELLAVSGTTGEALLPGAIPPSVRTLEHWGEPDPALVLELSAREGADWSVDVVEEHLRPEEIFGAERFRRPPGLVEEAGARADRAVIRTPWSPALAGSLPGDGAGEAPAVVVPDSAAADMVPDSAAADSVAAVPDSARAPEPGDTVPDSAAAVPDSATTSPSAPRRERESRS